MEANNIRGQVAGASRIMLVDHDTDSLMSLASMFEQQSYIVFATESAKVALSLLRDTNTCYDAVIADTRMPEMDVYEFVDEVLRQRMNIPVMLIDENPTMESVREAIVHHRVCYVFPKPMSHLDVGSFWWHVSRVMVKNSEENNASKSKKKRITWNRVLHKKFLDAIETLGRDARPSKILDFMNEPDLRYGHVASHLQKHRNETRHSGSASSGMQYMREPHRNIVQGQTSSMPPGGTAQIPRSPGCRQIQEVPGLNQELAGIEVIIHGPDDVEFPDVDNGRVKPK